MVFLLSLLALAYLLFLAWLHGGLRKCHGDQTDSNLGESPSVSIIVAARNEEGNIVHLLSHLRGQDYPDDRVEIVIANDDSSDATGDIVQKISNDDSRVRHVFVDDTPPDWSPKKWALSRGVQESQGEIFFFTDADCTVGSQWIRTVVSCFGNPEVGIVAGPSPLEKTGTVWDRMLLWESIGQDALAAGGFTRGMPLTASGRNLAIRRSAFDSVNGYGGIHSFFSGDDDLMMHKVAHAGWKIEFCMNPAGEVTSAPPPGFGAFLRQRLRFASKGKTYYRLPFVRGYFKVILPLIFLANLAVLSGMAAFLVTLKSVWLFPWFLKVLGDGILVTKYAWVMGRRFDIIIFILDELWHSLYVVVLGILGSFVPISWKGRRRKLRTG